MYFRYNKISIRQCVLSFSIILFLSFLLAFFLYGNSANAIGGPDGSKVKVTVNMDVPDAEEDMTYGPIALDLIKVDDGSVVMSTETEEIDVKKNSGDQTIHFTKAEFNGVGDTTKYKVCTQSETPICSAEFTKLLLTPATATIDITKDESADFIGASGDGSEENTCGSSVKLLGWIVCPILNAIVTLNDILWSITQSMLNVNPLQQNQPIYEAWGSIRSIANVIFVIFFMIIIFSQLTGAGITNYGVKKLLPKIIVAAILVNVSFIIVQVAVDLSNIVGSSLYNLIHALIPNTEQHTWQMLLDSVLAGTLTAGAAVITAAVVAGSAAGFYMMVPFVAMGLLGMVAAFLTLAFRQAAIPILAILAPLAFVAYLLPNTESWFKKWRGMLMSMLILYPLASVIFAGSQFAATIVIGDGKNFLNYLIGMTILALPLFSLPFLARQGGPLLNKVSGALNGVAERARKPLSNWSKDRADAARADYLANRPSTAFGRSRIGRMVGTPRRIARNNALRRNNREKNMEKNKLNLQTQMDQNTTGHMGDSILPSNRETRQTGAGGQQAGTGGAQAKDNLAIAKKAAKIEENTETHRQDRSHTGMRQDEQLAHGELRHKTDMEDTSHRVANDFTPGGGSDLHRAYGEAVLQSKADTQDIAHRLDTSAAGIALHQQIGEREKRATLDTKGIAHHLETSQAGIGLNQRIGAAELIARTDKASTEVRVESDPELAGLRLEAAGAELDASAAKAQTQQLVTEATTAGGSEAVEAALLPSASAGPVDAAVADAALQQADQISVSFQHAQRSTDVAAQGSAAAGRVQKTELRQAVLADGPGGPGSPSTTAVAMGGIDPHGIDRAIAGSIMDEHKTNADHITAASTRIIHSELTQGELRELAEGRAVPRAGLDAGADLATRQAAIDRAIAVGDVYEMTSVWDSIAGMPNNEETVQLRNRLAESLSSQSDRPAWMTQGEIELMRVNDPAHPYRQTIDAIGHAVDQNRYSPEYISRASNDELDEILTLAASGQLTDDQVARVSEAAHVALNTERLDNAIRRSRETVENLDSLATH